MKSNTFTTLLLGILTISAVASVALCWWYGTNVRELRSLQLQAASVQNNRNMAGMLANDVVEYSKRNPAIDPILESVGLKNRAAAPAAKPATK